MHNFDGAYQDSLSSSLYGSAADLNDASLNAYVYGALDVVLYAPSGIMYSYDDVNPLKALEISGSYGYGAFSFSAIEATVAMTIPLFQPISTSITSL